MRRDELLRSVGNAILDRRVVTRGYGARILAALPPAPRTASLDDVKAFWERIVEDDSAAGIVPTVTEASSIRDAADDSPLPVASR